MIQQSPSSLLIFCWICLHLIASKVIVVAKQTKNSSSHDDCDIFLAPSSDFGWGVYAARNFQKDEIVEYVPAYLPLDSQGVELQSSILLDYIHEQGCGGSNEGDDKDQLFLGHGSSYNHHSDDPNIQFTEYSIGTGHVITVQAIRNITMGEELFARYGDDDWFTSRNIRPKQNHSPSTIPQQDLSFYKSHYCSKIQGGVGIKTWNETILPHIPKVPNLERLSATNRLAPNDAGFGEARAKVDLAVGDRIELSLGLLLSERIMADFIVAPLLLRWKDLTMEQQRTMRILRKNFKDEFVLYYPGQQQELQQQIRYDAFKSYDDLAILPIGTLALVRKVGRDSSNCRLKIREYMNKGSTSLALELVATKSIRRGQVLLLDMPPSGSSQEWALLEQELKRTGQPYHASTFVSTNLREEL